HCLRTKPAPLRSPSPAPRFELVYLHTTDLPAAQSTSQVHHHRSSSSRSIAGALFLILSRAFGKTYRAGAILRILPEKLSVASQSAPSGPWRTSRTRSRSCCSSRSSLTIVLPLTSSRTSISPISAPMNRLPRHLRNSSPV